MNPTLKLAISAAFKQRDIAYAFGPEPRDPLDGTMIKVGPHLAVRIYETRPNPSWSFAGDAALVVGTLHQVFRGQVIAYDPTRKGRSSDEFVAGLAAVFGVDRSLLTIRRRRRVDHYVGHDLIVAGAYVIRLDGHHRSLPRHFRRVRSAMRKVFEDYADHLDRTADEQQNADACVVNPVHPDETFN